jgi:hypothetical protein
LALFEEIKNLPESIISMKEDIKAQFLTQFTLIEDTDTAVQSVKSYLTRNLSQAISEIDSESEDVLEKCIPLTRGNTVALSR